MICVLQFSDYGILLFFKDLLLRVEQAVDKFLFWDEEVTICEAVTSVSIVI